MASPAASLPERLRDALVALTPDNTGALDALEDLYANDVVFKDPIQEVRGLDAFLALNRRLLSRMRALAWTVHTTEGHDDCVFLEWTMRATPRFGPTVTVDGVTRARARDGKIHDHRDYWDLGELFASGLPGGQRVLQTLLKPFA